MTHPGADSVVCPMCRAENRPDASRCFHCGQSLAGPAELAPPKPATESAGRLEPTLARDRRGSHFWGDLVAIILAAILASVVLVVATVAAFFGTCLAVWGTTDDSNAGLFAGVLIGGAVFMGLGLGLGWALRHYWDTCREEDRDLQHKKP